MKKTIIRIILIVLIALWMYTVFIFSAQNGENSGGLSFKISMLLTGNRTEWANVIQPYVRKLAHLSEYLVGGMLVYTLMLTFEKMKENNKVIISIAFGIIYAASDEFHQLYVPGRTGSIVDAYIDTIGFVKGVLYILLLRKIIERYKKNKLQKGGNND